MDAPTVDHPPEPTGSSRRSHLVIGASGFLGSHVVRQLVEQGEQVRVLVRATSSTQGIDGLPVERHVGDVHDAESVRRAMAGVDVVHHCVVDARPWLRDPAPLYRTNVEGLRTVLDVAADHDLHRFVHTSSIGTLPIADRATGAGPVTEQSGPHNWLERGGDYIRSRVQGEDLALSYAAGGRVPVVSMCVANTYGSGDFLPTPHGGFVKLAARGRQSWYVRGVGAEAVGVRDAARALVLAGERGAVGERYIVSERHLSMRDVLDTAADAAGVARPRTGIPVGVLAAGGFVGEQVARILRRDIRLTRTSIRLMHVMTPLDHGKATRELGWEPAPVHDAIREAAAFFTQRKRNQ
ncbi:NAD-dependent dehydratase [Nocardioides sp. Root190]|uniref:NAD-dependent epimerase/dehydratase family protein n=1 Tax=Nocardioides sp. Root190 TaxID=1736488 RepID=UPI0006FC8773|nr:NAD-dependent epimerase/dehydratase family protein [Nocardioides sp. Root190]KRB76569.1 NAD-dependent dehydratase [Nocardioides sp. Root190]